MLTGNRLRPKSTRFRTQGLTLLNNSGDFTHILLHAHLQTDSQSVQHTRNVSVPSDLDTCMRLYKRAPGRRTVWT